MGEMTHTRPTARLLLLSSAPQKGLFPGSSGFRLSPRPFGVEGRGRLKLTPLAVLHDSSCFLFRTIQDADIDDSLASLPRRLPRNFVSKGAMTD